MSDDPKARTPFPHIDPDLTEYGLRAMALRWEDATGADSIDTIENVYDRTDSGAYICCYPYCQYARHDPVDLWAHVHWSRSRRHGKPVKNTDLDPSVAYTNITDFIWNWRDRG